MKKIQEGENYAKKKFQAVDQVLADSYVVAGEQLAEYSKKPEVNPEFEFSIDFENSESEILRKDDLSSEEMIEAIVMKH